MPARASCRVPWAATVATWWTFAGFSLVNSEPPVADPSSPLISRGQERGNSMEYWPSVRTEVIGNLKSGIRAGNETDLPFYRQRQKGSIHGKVIVV